MMMRSKKTIANWHYEFLFYLNRIYSFSYSWLPCSFCNSSYGADSSQRTPTDGNTRVCFDSGVRQEELKKQQQKQQFNKLWQTAAGNPVAGGKSFGGESPGQAATLQTAGLNNPFHR